MRKRVFIIILFSLTLLGFLPSTCNPLIEHTVMSNCNYDAQVSSSSPNINYGDTINLKVSSNSSTSTLHYTYLAFSIKSLPFLGEDLKVILDLNNH